VAAVAGTTAAAAAATRPMIRAATSSLTRTIRKEYLHGYHVSRRYRKG
jgi:hypothetical protein